MGLLTLFDDVEAIKKSISSFKKEMYEIQETLLEMKELVKDLRVQIVDQKKQEIKEGDLPVYNLKGGLYSNCPLIDNLPKNITKPAKARMEAYKQMYQKNLDDMKRNEAIYKAEAEMHIEDIKSKYGLS